MKITEVKTVHLRLPVVTDKADGSQDALLVKVTTDAGITGVGQVDASPLASIGAILAPNSSQITRGLREAVLGEDPLEREHLWHRMYDRSIYFGRRGAAIQAMSGIDLALWDIAGKALKLPVYKLAGGGFHKRLRAYSSFLWQDTPEETAQAAARLKAEGFTAYKFGWNRWGQDWSEDEAQVATVREVIGPNVNLMIDAGFGYRDAKSAIQMAERLERYGVYWLEEPFRPDDYEGYAKLARATSLRIAAGEEETNRLSYIDLMDRGQVDVVQVDLCRVGGMTEALKIGWLAYDRGRLVINHSYSTDINLAASLHFLACMPHAELLEFCMEPGPLRRELVKTPLKMVDGYVAVPEEPGLGVELDEEVAERYAVKQL
ncbi:MAG TPA: mandelate racemase/muconate lactonizing enzyme family protein [Chloroflexota bacterium]